MTGTLYRIVQPINGRDLRGMTGRIVRVYDTALDMQLTATGEIITVPPLHRGVIVADTGAPMTARMARRLQRIQRMGVAA